MKIHFSSSRGKTKSNFPREFLEIETLVQDWFQTILCISICHEYGPKGAMGSQKHVEEVLEVS